MDSSHHHAHEISASECHAMAFGTLLMTCDLRLLVCSYDVQKQMRL
jgi:hypothetical protein